MMTLIYEGQAEWKRGGDPYPLLSGIASAAGLDTARLGQCYEAHRCTDGAGVEPRERSRCTSDPIIHRQRAADTRRASAC